MKFIYIVTFLILFCTTKGNSAIIMTSDNRISLKPTQLNTLRNDRVILKSQLSHYNWVRLIYSDKIIYKNQKILSIIKGGVFTPIKEIKKVLPDNMHKVYFSYLCEKIALRSKQDKNFGEQEIIDNMTTGTAFFVYFQEILKLEIEVTNLNNKSIQTFSFLLGTNNIASLVIMYKLNSGSGTNSEGRH